MVSATDPYGRFLGFLDREWRISETNLEPTTSTICEVKTEHSTLERIDIYEKSATCLPHC
jgi:hypothetical protein